MFLLLYNYSIITGCPLLSCCHMVDPLRLLSFVRAVVACDIFISRPTDLTGHVLFQDYSSIFITWGAPFYAYSENHFVTPSHFLCNTLWGLRTLGPIFHQRRNTTQRGFASFVPAHCSFSLHTCISSKQQMILRPASARRNSVF